MRTRTSVNANEMFRSGNGMRQRTRALSLISLAALSTFLFVGTSHAATAPQRTLAAPDDCQVWFIPFFGGAWLAGASWTDRSDNEDGFIVEWRAHLSPPDSGNAVTVANATGVSVTFVPAGTTVSCRVRAFNANGTSHWSNRDSASAP